MKIKYLILLIFFIGINLTRGQDKYKGNFSKTEKFISRNDFIPIRTHKVFDEDENLSYKIKYSKNGIIRKIKISQNGKNLSVKFPKKIDQIVWQKITDGLWINKVKENFYGKTEFNNKDIVKLHYDGHLINGKPFDNSFIRNQPLKGELGYFIKGFSIGLNNIKEGELRIIKIAPEMGYGNKEVGNIPQNSTLIYYVYRID
ncbi:FKBP-type peptidyl-prolyl cis-trans isomerase [Urechidicola croceus]|uniref:Peptidyl-prolyl cis-trans isomerase n=1 Tax=Urechidicola croceus TaxID=1850246 RepID=A0A1D8P442_9FLAO|nr:FKBP-type peptidyl-prolyl cis-trans isomerase [Urechidicola croceus]AOW19363.1 hypothetical protein LPB138_01095 [Urechidicola croceus]